MATLYGHYQPKTDKWYIGVITKTNTTQKRWQNGKGYINNHQKKFENAILKYGWDSFEHIIFFDDLTDEEADRLEVEYIKKYDSFKNGYNSTEGGDMKSPGCTRKGMKNSQRQKDAVRKSMIKYLKNTDYTGGNNPHAKPIKCYDILNDKHYIFNSCTEAGEYFNLNPISIAQNVRRGNSSYKRQYKFEYL
jgi:hypothetical protein